MTPNNKNLQQILTAFNTEVRTHVKDTLGYIHLILTNERRFLFLAQTAVFTKRKFEPKTCNSAPLHIFNLKT